MNKKLFSIIVPAFNYAHLLGRAISSVLAQSGDDFELIIIDDGSTDDTEKVVEVWREKEPKVLRYHKQKNRGAAVARNKGVDISEGRYIIFLDADDALMEGALEHFRCALQREPMVELFVGGHQTVDQSGKIKQHPIQKSYTSCEENFKAYLTKRLSISHGAFAAKKILFKQIRYPEGLRSGEDIPVFGQLLASAKVCCLESLQVIVHKHPESLRQNTIESEQEALLLVDLLFDASILPALMLKYKKSYRARRFLSLMRSSFLAGHYDESRKWFIKAVKERPSVLFQLSYFRKFLKALLMKNRRES